jgi:hypothetical protein
MREVRLAEAVATLEDKRVLERTRTVDAREEPSEDVVSLDVRGTQAELRGLCFDFFFGNRRMLPRAKSL